MLRFKDIEAFKRRIQDGPNWDDYFRMGSKLFKMYEYGDGHGYNYVYFLNKKTHDAIYVKYICPSTQWVKIPEVCEEDGGKHALTHGGPEYGNMNYCSKCLRREREQETTDHYRFIELEYIPNMELWRTDTV